VRILFISHEASLTGAPLFLLQLCKYLKQETDWELQFLLKKEGPLGKEFSKIGKVYTFQSRSNNSNIISKIKSRITKSKLGKELKLRDLKLKLKKQNLDLIYSNTATNGNLLHELSDLNIKIITHVHELEWAITSFGQKNLELTQLYSSYYISTSPAVTKFIQSNLSDSTYVFEFKCFPIHEVPVDINTSALKVNLGIPADGFVIGSAGTVEWRKGWDLFVKLAWELKHLDQAAKVYFVWIGKVDEKIIQEVEYEVELAGLKQIVFFIGQKENPMQYYALFDVFCLMSREEAFGIVALENAQLKTPILCFDKSEGLVSFIQSDAGIVIPYLNTHKMAESILMLRNNPDVPKRMGETASKRVKDYYNIEDQGQKLINFLNSISTA
jgi:glycosyltransferase involved in cell wall biosynthesis